jgi:hypothetical protein
MDCRLSYEQCELLIVGVKNILSYWYFDVRVYIFLATDILSLGGGRVHLLVSGLSPEFLCRS